MSDFFFFLPPLPFLFFLVFHSLKSKKKIIKGIERKNSNKVQSDNCSALASVLDWTAEVKLLVLRVVIWSVLQYHAVEQGLKNTRPLWDYDDKAGVWALVSWLFGSLTRHIFWLIELSSGLNSKTVCYIKLGLGRGCRVLGFFSFLLLWEEILPGYVLLRRTFCSSTYYSGLDGQISKEKWEEKKDLEAF